MRWGDCSTRSRTASSSSSIRASPESGHNFDTAHRVAALQADLKTCDWDGLVLATCVHGEDGSCDCAKPGHGLITAQLDSGRRAEDGWYIGGDQEGMVAGRSAGLHTIRIGPHGSDHLSVVHRPDFEARDLMDAANHIMVEVLTRAWLAVVRADQRSDDRLLTTHQPTGSKAAATASLSASPTRNGSMPFSMPRPRSFGGDHQPGHADEVDRQVADDHGAQRSADVAVPAKLRQPADDAAGQQEADQVAASRCKR